MRPEEIEGSPEWWTAWIHRPDGTPDPPLEPIVVRIRCGCGCGVMQYGTLRLMTTACQAAMRAWYDRQHVQQRPSDRLGRQDTTLAAPASSASSPAAISDGDPLW